MLRVFRALLWSAVILANSSQLQAQSQNGPDGNAVYTYVEQMPVFPGGQQALFQTLGQTLVYPTEALRQRVAGTVFVTFVVATTGMPSNIKVNKANNPLLDAEAVRAVSSLPAFIPGKQVGRPVPVAFTIPIRFVLPPNLDQILAYRDSVESAQKQVPLVPGNK
jgi:TonB family protein